MEWGRLCSHPEGSAELWAAPGPCQLLGWGGKSLLVGEPAEWETGDSTVGQERQLHPSCCLVPLGEVDREGWRTPCCQGCVCELFPSRGPRLGLSCGERQGEEQWHFLGLNLLFNK